MEKNEGMAQAATTRVNAHNQILRQRGNSSIG